MYFCWCIATQMIAQSFTEHHVIYENISSHFWTKIELRHNLDRYIYTVYIVITYIYTVHCTCTYTCTCMYILCTHVQVLLCTYTYSYTHMYMYIHVLASMYVYTCIMYMCSVRKMKMRFDLSSIYVSEHTSPKCFLFHIEVYGNNCIVYVNHIRSTFVKDAFQIYVI